MKIHHKSHVKLAVIIVLIAIAAMVGLFVYFRHFKTSTDNTVNISNLGENSVKSDASNNSSTNNPDDTGDKTPTQASDANGQSVTNNNASDKSKSSDLKIDASFTAQPDTISVVINITNLTSNSGNCVITAGSYNATVPVIANSNYSSCEINSIPTSKASLGQKFSVNITSDGRSGSASGTIQ